MPTKNKVRPAIPASVGIIGAGVVGTATARVWMEHTDVKVYDSNPTRCSHSLNEVLTTEIIFICLPSPQAQGGLSCDTSIIEGLLETLAGTMPNTNYVLRSTVPVGFTTKMRERYKLTNLIHGPEFLTARCAITDAHMPTRNVIGSPTSGTNAAPVLASMYRSRFPGAPLMVVRPEESEMIKLVVNTFFSVKVAFFNEARSLSDSLDLDWDSILAGVMSDGRIAHSHTKVPGPDGKYGFGGTCLPKDTANFVSCCERSGIVNTMARAALSRNEHDRTKERK